MVGVALMIITSLIAMYSLLKVFFYMYFGREEMPVVQRQPILPHKLIAMILLTVATILMGLCAEWILDVAHHAAEFNINPSDYIKSVIPNVEVE